jgi:serine/threonine protein kinase
MRKSPDDFEMQYSHGMEVDLGRGSSGQVKLVKDRGSGRLYAMKIVTDPMHLQVKKQQLFETMSVDILKREIKIQRKLNNPYVVRLHHYFEDKRYVYLILEYACMSTHIPKLERGTLFSYLRRRGRLSETEAQRFFL